MAPIECHLCCRLMPFGRMKRPAIELSRAFQPSIGSRETNLAPDIRRSTRLIRIATCDER
jgi:hypothetical protein